MAISTQSLIPAANISSSGLNAERARMEIVANNLANANSTGTDGKDVYKKRIAVFDSVFNDQITNEKNPTADLAGVKLKDIAVDKSEPIKTYAPNNPAADAQGMVSTPNISPIEEMLDMITSSRAYEANLNVLSESRRLADKTINMFKGS
jgi:flagellar basal-body rod protein FlgC